MSINLNCNLSSLRLNGCIYNASGPLCTTNKELHDLNAVIPVQY